MQDNKSKMNKMQYDIQYVKDNIIQVVTKFNRKKDSDNTLYSRLEYYCQINNISKNQAIKEAIETYLNAKEY